MIRFASLIPLLLFTLCNHHVSGYVAAFATKTYDVYDRPTPRLDNSRAGITPPLELRQFSGPDSHNAKALNSRPTSHPSILQSPVTANNTQQCLLWDPACYGNRSAALLEFFDKTMPMLIEDSCFATGPQWDRVCTKSPSPGPSLIDSWSTMRSWMRSPACQTGREEANRLHPSVQTHDPPSSAGCCGNCAVGGPNVDVYFWESPDANTDCLSIVGTDVAPLLDGATTKGGTTYWAVTTPGTNENNAIVTTAVYTSVNGISFKLPLHNPWDAMTYSDGIHQDGRSTPTTSAAFPGITPPPEFAPSVKARANVIPIGHIRPRAGRNTDPRSSTEAPILPTNGSRVSTVVYNGHTFTSPSIYVDFYSLAATDDCGYLGSSNVITSTLLSFAPGELSTYGGPLINILHAELFTPTVYNFADLPCPPQSIMYDQWYKPEPGYPFRPILAFPSKVLDIDPAWASCAASLFTGVDPPRALAPTNAMAAPGKSYDAFAPQTMSDSLPIPTLETQAQVPSAPKQQDSQMVAPQKTSPPPVPITKGNSFTSTSPAQPGSKPATPQISGEIPAGPGNKEAASQISAEVPVHAAQTFASVGGYPIVALPLQRNSRTLDRSISAAASNTSDLAADYPNVDISPDSNDAPVGGEALAQGGSQTSDISFIQKTPTVDTAPASDLDSVATFGISSSSGDSGGAPANDGSQKTYPSDNEQSSNHEEWTNSSPNQSDGPIPQVYQVGSSQITAGGPTLTISGTEVFAPTSGDCVIVGGQTFHPSHLSDYVIGSTPMAEGAQPTSIGEQQQVNFNSHNTDYASNSQANSPVSPTNNIAGNIITPLPSNAGIAVDGITLSPGGKATASRGQVVSNAGNGIVVVGNQTAKLKIPSAGTGARNDASTAAGIHFLPFEGRASRGRGMLCWHWVWSFAAMFVGLMRR